MPESGTAPTHRARPLPGIDGHIRDHRAAVASGFAGWLLDSFDFFLVTFCLTAIAKEFHRSDAQVALVITATLAFRPVGGFVFGMLADRYGRRIPFMANVALFAFIEIGTGLASSFVALLTMRCLFGVVMGGQWGVGASMAMEKAPARRRGMLSGLLQEGYAAGSVMAALSYFSLFGRFGWRPLFFLGTVPALLLVLFAYFRVGESEVWKLSTKRSWKEQGREVASHWKLFLYLVAFMTAMLLASHGTQDMYPTFLQRQWHFSPMRRSAITACAGVGAIIGGIVVGHLSDRWGRRRSMIGAFILAIFAIPLWSFARSEVTLIVGAFVMQFLVQGAWGVVPAHLAELSPNSVRAFLPGFAYQTAGVIAGSVVYIEALFAQRSSYAIAMALTAITVFTLASVVAALGRERLGHTFLDS